MIITQTPLRISFAGGGTDFREFFTKHGGCVVSSSIDKYIYVIVKKRFDDEIRINYSKKEIVNSVDEIQHELVREAMRKTGVRSGIEISTLADIPSEGSGLGSSSSVTVGILNALYHYQGVTVPAEKLAEEACEIEIDICGRPIGVQDQYIAAFGGLRFFDFRTDGSVVPVRLNTNDGLREDLDAHLMLFYTGKTRKAETILSEQRENIPVKEKVLCQMAEQARRLKKSLESGDYYVVGRAMKEGWELKKKLASKISNGEIDSIYEKALAAGARGGKITGAGGGGFCLLFVPPNNRQNVRRALSDWRELPFHLERDGSNVIFNTGQR